GARLAAVPGWMSGRRDAGGGRHARGPRDRTRPRGRRQCCPVRARAHSARGRGALDRPAGERGPEFSARHRHVVRARALSGDTGHQNLERAACLGVKRRRSAEVELVLLRRAPKQFRPKVVFTRFASLVSGQRHNRRTPMFSVIFEVFPHEERFDEYLALAKHLKPILETIDGFVDTERCESTGRPCWLLSHSTWRDEKSVVRWRTTGEHHAIQAKGRSEVFRDYHLRVGDVTADTDAPKQAPVREQRFDETEIGAAKLVTMTEITPEPGTALGVHDDLL